MQPVGTTCVLAYVSAILNQRVHDAAVSLRGDDFSHFQLITSARSRLWAERGKRGCDGCGLCWIGGRRTGCKLPRLQPGSAWPGAGFRPVRQRHRHSSRLARALQHRADVGRHADWWRGQSVGLCKRCHRARIRGARAVRARARPASTGRASCWVRKPACSTGRRAISAIRGRRSTGWPPREFRYAKCR